jgi:alkaline phosphatase D
VSTSSDFSSPSYSSPVATANRVARLSITGLAAGTNYYYGIEINGSLDLYTTGTFRTSPTASFTFGFATCNSSGSNHVVFDQIISEDPDFFIHIGDLHYHDFSTANTQQFLSAYDEALAAGPGKLFRQVTSYYMFDDHDYGPNDGAGDFVGRDNAIEAYRQRVPYPTLEEVASDGAVYYSFEVGRCMFIVTDLRSESTNKSATDNSSKTMMGAAQKTWFKGLLSDVANAGKFFFWVNSRVWTTLPVIAGHDSWAGFTTERTELADHVKANCLGRIAIVTGDRHQLGIDDGSNSDYATGGGCPIPVFMAAPLDRPNNTHGSGTFSEGGVFNNNGQYGLVTVTDGGGATITIDMVGKKSDGSTLVTYQFVATLS